MSTAMLSGVRWSTAVRCSRAAAYQALGVEALPYSPETERMFLRGTQLGRAMAESVAAGLEAQGRTALAEVECPWPREEPIGVGHADLHIPDESTVIEVYSTTDGSFPRMKALQGVGYALSLEAQQVKVLAVHPSSYEERVYPVNVEALRPEVEAIMAEVVGAVRDGVIPERLNGAPNAHPGQFQCQDCPFRRTCWEGWQPPPAGRLPGMDEDLRRLAEVSDQLTRIKRATDLEAERDAIRERIAPMMEAGQDYIEGGVKVRRTQVAGRRSLSLSAMEAAGYSLPPEIAEFVTEGKPFDKWTVKELSS